MAHIQQLLASASYPILTDTVFADAHLRAVLRREQVDAGIRAPVRRVDAALSPLICRWAGSSLVRVHPSGSFAKGTANRSGTDIDLFICLREDTEAPLKAIYDSLHSALTAAGLTVRRQNVSLNVKVLGFSVDLVPGKRQNRLTLDHSLYCRRRDTWLKTNVLKHVDWIHSTGRQDEMRLMKLWRDQHQLDWPSFYVELATARALSELLQPGTPSSNLRRALVFVRDEIERARFVDPANGNNTVSDTLTGEEKRAVARAAAASLNETDIRRIVR